MNEINKIRVRPLRDLGVRPLRKLTRTQKVVLGFLAIIFAGACLLMLPFATRDGQVTTFAGALFCSVSATCVTGLVVYDTFTHWTLFGQLVLLIEMQIGGLGFITISTFMMVILRRKIGVSRRAMIQDSLNTLHIKGSVLLVRRIIIGTLFLEGTGAILMACRFIPTLGFFRGLYYGIFHAISAFCNAGFDLMGYQTPYTSLTGFVGDPLIILTISVLIIMGGLGFVVWEDLWIKKYHWSRYQFYTKLVLVSTASLLVGGTILFMILEKNRLFADMPLGEKWLAAFFSAVTPRTAGFNSVDTASLSNGSLFLTIVLMFIGGNPGSTAGGVKTITIVVMLLSIKAYLLREKDCVIFKRRIDDEAVRKAMVMVSINLFLAVLGVMGIYLSQELPLPDVLFEVFSAIDTVGMTTGITRDLTQFSQIVIMILMFAGRMGTLTFAMSFTEQTKVAKIRYPKGDITL